MSQDSPTPEELRNLARAPQIDQPLLDEQEFDPEEARQPRPLSGNPIVKLAIVGGSLLPIFLFAGVFLGNRQETRDQNAQPTASVSPSASPAPEAQINQREKLGQTEAQLALEKQRLELERWKQTASAKKAVQKPVARSTVRVDRPVAVAPPSYTPSQPMPRIMSPSPRIAVAPPEVVTPVVSQPVVRQSSPKRVAPADPLPELDATQSPEPQLQSPIDLAHDKLGLTEVTSEQVLANGTVNPKRAMIIAQGEALQVMATGTKAEGVLQTSIVIDETMQKKTPLKLETVAGASQRNPDDRFVVVLSEPLQAHDRTIALPAGTQVVTQIHSISDGGLIKLSAVSAIVNHNGQRTEIALPSGTIQIRGREGAPLIAKRHNDAQPEIAARDTQMAALNAIRRASEIYTRSDGNLIINHGSLSKSNRKSGADLLAGALQGLSESLINRAVEQNERAIAELEKRSDIYQIKAGTPVEIYVNYPVQMPGEFAQAMRMTQDLSKPVLAPEIDSKPMILPLHGFDKTKSVSDSFNTITNDN